MPGLRAGHYLCFFGMHVLTPTVMAILSDMVGNAGERPVALSEALNELAQRERYLALANLGRRYDVGATYGLLNAQLALGRASCSGTPAEPPTWMWRTATSD